MQKVRPGRKQKIEPNITDVFKRFPNIFLHIYPLKYKIPRKYRSLKPSFQSPEPSFQSPKPRRGGGAPFPQSIASLKRNATFLTKHRKARADTRTALEICPPPRSNARRDETSRSGESLTPMRDDVHGTKAFRIRSGASPGVSKNWTISPIVKCCACASWSERPSAIADQQSRHLPIEVKG